MSNKEAQIAKNNNENPKNTDSYVGISFHDNQNLLDIKQHKSIVFVDEKTLYGKIQLSFLSYKKFRKDLKEIRLK